jgi:hypothetical protein
MKRSLLLALPLLFAATPAFATGGFDCRTTDGSDIMMSGTIGRVIGTPLVAAHLQVDGRTLGTNDPEPQIAIARSWIDQHEIKVDLVEGQAERFAAELRVRLTRRGDGNGTLVRDGRTYQVYCTVE